MDTGPPPTRQTIADHLGITTTAVRLRLLRAGIKPTGYRQTPGPGAPQAVYDPAEIRDWLVNLDT